MKRVFVFSISAILAVFSVSAFADAQSPDIKPGTSMSFEKVDKYGKVESQWKIVFGALAENCYEVVKYDAGGAVLDTYKLTKNLGPCTPTKAGLLGDGVQYKFPLKVGDTWTTTSHWDHAASNSAGFDEMTYTVVAEEEKKVKAGKFMTLKIAGEGKWKNTTLNFGGKVFSETYYAPAAQSYVWSKRIVRPDRGPTNEDTFEATAVDLK